MSDEPQTNSEPAEGTRVPESPGQRIRLAREKARLTIEELAALTRLPRSTLEALERNDYDALQEPVFVRGYYRKCAGVLGIPEALLLDAYQGRRPDKPLARADRLSLWLGADLGPSRERDSRLTILAPTLAIVVCVGLWFLYGPSRSVSPGSMSLDRVSVTGSATASAGPGIPVTALPQPLGPDLQDSQPASLPSEESAGPEPGSDSLAALDLSPAPAEPLSAVVEAPRVETADAVPQPGQPGDALVVAVGSNSWARIEDAQGQVLVNRVLAAGERETLSGKPPYSVVIGYAPGVSLSFAGQPVDFQRFVSSNATARFSVPVNP